MRRTSFEHRFVDSVPPELEEGVLYVSVKYATAMHKCACGCGNKVVTPIKPVSWHLLFDGKSVSLTPSIGNWQFPCRSHYWIEKNKVRWAGDWTPEEVALGREREARERERYFAGRQMAASAAGQTDTEAQPEKRPRKGLVASVLRWLGRKKA